MIFDITVNVKEKEDGDYVYSFAATKIKGSERPKAPTLYSAPGTINAPVRGISPANATNNIPQPASDFNPEIKKSTRAQTDSEEFKCWFKSSKIINEDGSPKFMYHGTP